MRHRVDIQAILRDRAKRRRLIAGAVRFIVSSELGRDLAWEQAYQLVDKEKSDDRA